MKGSIYKLQCKLTDKFYIGSTIHTLQYRLKKHRSSSKDPVRMNSPLYTHFRKIGWENASMILLTETEIDDKKQLLELEKEEILKYLKSELCLNHNIPIRTKEEKQQQNKEYNKFIRNSRPERERNRLAEWRKNNPEKYAEQKKRTVEQQRIKRQNKIIVQ